jgi:hypothetical protein
MAGPVVTTTFNVNASQAVDATNAAAKAIEEFGKDALEAGREAQTAFDKAGTAIDEAMRDAVVGSREASAAIDQTATAYRVDSDAIVAALQAMGVAASLQAERQQEAADDTIVYLARIANEAEDTRAELARLGRTSVDVGDQSTAAAKEIESSFAKLGGEAASMGRKVLGTGVAILGFASIVEGSRKVIEMTRRAIADYIADTEELTPIAGAASAATTGFRDALLGQYLTTENLTVLVGTYQSVLDALTSATRMSEGSTRGLADALAGGFVSATLAAVNVTQALGNILTGAKLAADAFRIAQLMLTGAVADLALLMRTGLSAALAEFIDLLATGARLAGDVLGRVIGEESVAALRNMETSLVGSAEATRQQTEALRMMREEAKAAVERGLDELTTSIGDTVASATVFNDRINTLREDLSETRDEIAAGSVELATYSAATQATTASVAQLVEELDKLKASRLVDFAEAQRLSAGIAEAQQLQLDKAKADNEARIALAREAAAELIALEEQVRAAAEETARTRIDAGAQTLGAVLSGQEKLADAARREAGEALKAAAQQFAALSAANFIALNPVKGAAYGLGAVGLYAAASALGATGGSAGGNVPSSAPATVTNVTNQSTSIVMQGVVTDEGVRQVAQMVNQAEDGGLLRRSA